MKKLDDKKSLIIIIIGICSVIAACIAVIIGVRSKLCKDLIKDECADCECTCDNCNKNCCNKFFDEEYSDPIEVEE